MTIQLGSYYHFTFRPCLNAKPRPYLKVDIPGESSKPQETLIDRVRLLSGSDAPNTCDVWLEDAFFEDRETALFHLHERLYMEREIKRGGGTELVMEFMDVEQQEDFWIIGNNEAVVEIERTAMAIV